jgi:hypothetical protein
MSRRSTHAERVLTGRLGAYTMLSRGDPRETNKAARRAFLDRFEREVDLNGALDPGERARRAGNGWQGLASSVPPDRDPFANWDRLSAGRRVSDSPIS